MLLRVMATHPWLATTDDHKASICIKMHSSNCLLKSAATETPSDDLDTSDDLPFIYMSYTYIKRPDFSLRSAAANQIPPRLHQQVWPC